MPLPRRRHPPRRRPRPRPPLGAASARLSRRRVHRPRRPCPPRPPPSHPPPSRPLPPPARRPDAPAAVPASRPAAPAPAPPSVSAAKAAAARSALVACASAAAAIASAGSVRGGGGARPPPAAPTARACLAAPRAYVAAGLRPPEPAIRCSTASTGPSKKSLTSRPTSISSLRQHRRLSLAHRRLQPRHSWFAAAAAAAQPSPVHVLYQQPVLLPRSRRPALALYVHQPHAVQAAVLYVLQHPREDARLDLLSQPGLSRNRLSYLIRVRAKLPSPPSVFPSLLCTLAARTRRPAREERWPPRRCP
jgi:hypothetical protein